MGHAFLDEGYNNNYNNLKKPQQVSRTNERHCVNSTAIKFVNKPIPNHLIEAKLQLPQKGVIKKTIEWLFN